jgi:mannose-6-phosphate isomerase-like protein (cupin superfamily)
MPNASRALLGLLTIATASLGPIAWAHEGLDATGPAVAFLMASGPQAPASSCQRASFAGSVLPPRVPPDADFTRPPSKPHAPEDLVFSFDQLSDYYRVPGEFTHRLTGAEYGFDSLSFIISETHPGGGPGLHVHDVEEAHVLLSGAAQYRFGDRTFTVRAPYVARVPAGTPHTFINAGTEPFNLIAVFPSKNPATTRVGPNPLVRAPGEAPAMDTPPRP